jgi:uracil-DNA glycosylase family 4
MLSNKQIRMLELLDKKVERCISCRLYENGKVTPYWTNQSRYVMITESPSKRETQTKIPFRGAGGQLLRTELALAGLKSKDFLIINSVQCVPINHNYKPTINQLEACTDNIRKYLKVINPEKIICFGNNAKYIFTQDTRGVLQQRGIFSEWDIGEDYIFPVMFTVNPSYCAYNPVEGVRMLREDILKFKNTKFERKIDWLFKEEDFLL